MMSRHGQWLAVVALLMGAPGCLGGADPVGTHEEAVTLSDVEQSGAFDAIAQELESGDCVGAAHVAVSLGHEIVWGSLDAISDLALLEIDGVISCSAPTVLLSSGDRRNMIKLRPLRASRPDPEPADPDSDSGSPDQVTCGPSARRTAAGWRG